eukprot:313355-Pelagomonas_calceolata.AAC.1
MGSCKIQITLGAGKCITADNKLIQTLNFIELHGVHRKLDTERKLLDLLLSNIKISKQHLPSYLPNRSDSRVRVSR